MEPASCASLLPLAMFTPGPFTMPEEVTTHLAASARCWGLPRTACRQISLACSQWMDLFLPWARCSAALYVSRGVLRAMCQKMRPRGEATGGVRIGTSHRQQCRQTPTLPHPALLPLLCAIRGKGLHAACPRIQRLQRTTGSMQQTLNPSQAAQSCSLSGQVGDFATPFAYDISCRCLYRQCAAWSAGKPGILRGAGPSAPPKNSLAACRAHQRASR
jgi:hypothetical protein